METVTSKAAWSRVRSWFDRYGMALEYDPDQELQARVSRLEDEVRRLRQDDRWVPTISSGDAGF